MAEGEELKTNHELTTRSVRAFLRPTAVNPGRIMAQVSDYARYDETKTGFSDREVSSPPAIREKASLIVSVVFFVEI